MKTMSMHIGWVGGAITLAALALALPVDAATAPGALMGAGSLSAALGCVTCLGVGIYAVSTGTWLSALLWSKAAFAGSLACAGVCAAALTM